MSNEEKALIIRGNNFKDLGDVIRIASATGQKTFHTKEQVQVVEIYPRLVGGYVVVIRFNGVKAPDVRETSAR